MCTCFFLLHHVDLREQQRLYSNYLIFLDLQKEIRNLTSIIILSQWSLMLLFFNNVPYINLKVRCKQIFFKILKNSYPDKLNIYNFGTVEIHNGVGPKFSCMSWRAAASITAQPHSNTAVYNLFKQFLMLLKPYLLWKIFHVSVIYEKFPKQIVTTCNVQYILPLVWNGK